MRTEYLKKTVPDYLPPECKVFEVNFPCPLCVSGNVPNLNPYDPWADYEG